MLELYTVIRLLGDVILIGGPIPLSVPDCTYLARVTVHTFIEKWIDEDVLRIEDHDPIPVDSITFECVYLNSNNVNP